MKSQRIASGGFTLVELTIVLIIIALLISGMMVPLSAQRDIQRIGGTQKQLAEIREALFGFAIINGRLPCPATATDPADAKYGVEDSGACAQEGFLPWRSLGVEEIDAWGIRRNSGADPFVGYFRYRVDAAFATNFTLDTLPNSSLSVQNAAGNSLTQAAPNSPVLIVYSSGPDQQANGANAGAPDSSFQAGERMSTFDDLLIWVGRPILLNRMISAGRLP